MITLKGSIAFTVKEATKWKRKGYSVTKIRKQSGDWLITLAILPPSLKECAI